MAGVSRICTWSARQSPSWRAFNAGKKKTLSILTWTSVCTENLLVARHFWDQTNDQRRPEGQDFKQLPLFLLMSSVLLANNSHASWSHSKKAQATSQSNAQISHGCCLHEICNHYTIYKHCGHISKYKIH